MNCVTTLFSHQQAAVDKLLPSRVGALLMEQGTGKTLAAIELVCRRQARIRRVVWVCPVSLKPTIRHEILKHTDCTAADVYTFDDKTTARSLPCAAWYIVGLESISGSDRVTLALAGLIDEDTFVIVDESSYIKTHNAKRTRRLTALAERARYRLILTGTPLSQGVVDLYAQMRFLSDKILGYRSFYSFAANHLEYSRDHPGLIVRSHNVGYLAAKIQPYVYQVTKAECLDLPLKLYDERYFHLTDVQWDAYLQAKVEILESISLDDWNSHVIFRLFTALQQIVCGFWRRRGSKGALRQRELRHRRLETLLNVLAAVPPYEKVIIWAKFHHSIDQITARLSADYGLAAVAQFHGGLSEHERHTQVERWRASGRYLVATQATGGHGLTLNEAATHVFYANGFKYAERVQAEDRSHRIGQTRPVTYIDLVSDGGIDRRIQEALAKKQNVVDAFKRQVEAVKQQKGKDPQDELRALVNAL